ncbi:hypothetical protein Tco_0149022, partial [Tanacetum coccineum]
MLDSEDSTATYTKAPTSPDYVLGPEEPEQAPPSPEFVPEPVSSEFMPSKDEVGDDDDDDDDSSDNDEDDNNYVKEDEDEEEEEEHLAPADSVPPPVHHILSPLPHILSPPLPVSPLPLPASPIYPLGYIAAMIWLRAETPSTFHPLPSSTLPSGTTPLPPIPLPTPSPPLLLPSTVCIAGVSEVTLPPQKRLCIALGLRYEVGKSSSAPTARPTGGFRADYGFVGTLDDEIRLLMSGQLNKLRRDRRAHARTARLMETGARISCKAWVQSMDASDLDRSEVRALQTIVLAQQTEIGKLQAADRRRHAQLVETLTLIRTLQTQKMAPKRTTTSTPATTTTPTTSVIDEQLKKLIDQGVADALVARDADRSRNGEDSHDSGTGVRRQAPPA